MLINACHEFSNLYTNTMSKDTGPSVGQMARNFAVAATDIAKSGFQKVSQEQYSSRMAICNQCEFWDGKARFGMGKCSKCGCTGAKQWFASSKCPIDKWGVLT